MDDFLDILAKDAKRTIANGYYTNRIVCVNKIKPLSLKKSITDFAHASVIAEIKIASPTHGILHKNPDVGRIASEMRNGGAIALSFITEPKHFMGSLSTFNILRQKVELPLLMKDIFLNKIQIEAASEFGADAILLIKTLFDRGYCECSLSDMIMYAHSKEIEVLLETHTKDEFSSSCNTEADLIGINNRDLRTLKVDIHTTINILQKEKPQGKIVVSESGIKDPHDIHLLKESGAQAFLVGSALMRTKNISQKVRELVTSL
ncbi:MAG: indole-3-glycerol-phosphate synthase [Candidatus Bathyarchaeota archaeon]|nr:MAG: indole-3-glycerol-phosphate synthase [Candidatus Bathyarchaeota archaeon]